MAQKKSCNKNYINISMAFDNLKFSMQLIILMKTPADFLQNVQVIHSVLVDSFHPSVEKNVAFLSPSVKKLRITPVTTKVAANSRKVEG